MKWRLLSIEWSDVGPALAMVTLTYPREFPMNGRRVKLHLNRFHTAWTRRFGATPQGAWKLEFQERGAPHIHLYVGRPDVSVSELRRWCRETWYGIVDSGDERHRNGVNVVPCRFGTAEKNAMRVGNYFWKHNAKSHRDHYQNRVPDGFEDVGRFWGTWGVRPVEHERPLSREEYVEVRRPVRALARRQSMTGRIRGQWGLNGLWTPSDDGIGTGIRLARWAEEATRSKAGKVLEGT